MIPSKEIMRKTSVFVLIMFRAYVYAYAYALEKTRFIHSFHDNHVLTAYLSQFVNYVFDFQS